jgi:hypothetical protein
VPNREVGKTVGRQLKEPPERGASAAIDGRRTTHRGADAPGSRDSLAMPAQRARVCMQLYSARAFGRDISPSGVWAQLDARSVVFGSVGDR